MQNVNVLIKTAQRQVQQADTDIKKLKKRQEKLLQEINNFD